MNNFGGTHALSPTHDTTNYFEIGSVVYVAVCFGCAYWICVCAAEGSASECELRGNGETIIGRRNAYGRYKCCWSEAACCVAEYCADAFGGAAEIAAAESGA